MSSNEIQKWADANMFEAHPVRTKGPQVHLIWATPEPLATLASVYKIYEGEPQPDLSKITQEEMEYYWEQVTASHLDAPLEFIKMHFLIEGVTRAFTHQMVRQRTAVYAQESLRFAVKSNMAGEAMLPPTIRPGTIESDVWLQALDRIEDSYNYLVNNGVPAEDARGLLPHAVTTRLHYCTDLRGLTMHAGNRLCTQAQFEWRAVFGRIVEAIHKYNGPVHTGWQWQTIAQSDLFRPVCYKLGRCPWGEEMARPCKIRERVDQGKFNEIDPAEWLLDPNAAR